MDYKERDGQLNLVKKRLEIGGDVWNWLFKKSQTSMEEQWRGIVRKYHLFSIMFHL